ncbi:unnamed protein product, partial [Chrysoparadoxa australica]
VHLYDHESGPGKKFLVAGNGGLNLTHSENLEDFSKRYNKDETFFFNAMKEFGPEDLRTWCHELGVETFIGTSGRVFPKKLKAAEILLTLRKKLEENPDFQLHLKHKLINLSKDKTLFFAGPNGSLEVKASAVILALGGGSWAKTGSDGKWISLMEKLGIRTAPLLPMNCGFISSWSKFFQENVERLPLKNVVLKFGDRVIKTEIMITPYGIEGTGVYALSAEIRNKILNEGKATLHLDLKPDWSHEKVVEKIGTKKSKDSLSNFFRKSYGIDKDLLNFIREFVDKDSMNSVEKLSGLLKECEIELTGIRPLDEAISTSGGVCFSELTESLEVKKISDLYIVGEMLDFEAPTGGY